MSDQENQKKEAARQFLERIANDETETIAARHIGPSLDTLRKWAQWYCPEQAAKHTHWKKVTGPKNKTGGQVSVLFTKPTPPPKRIKKETQMVTLPIQDAPPPVRAKKAVAIVFQGDALSVGDMVRNALRGD